MPEQGSYGARSVKVVIYPGVNIGPGGSASESPLEGEGVEGNPPPAWPANTQLPWWRVPLNSEEAGGWEPTAPPALPSAHPSSKFNWKSDCALILSKSVKRRFVINQRSPRRVLHCRVHSLQLAADSLPPTPASIYPLIANMSLPAAAAFYRSKDTVTPYHLWHPRTCNSYLLNIIE